MSEPALLGLRQFRERIADHEEVIKVIKTRGDITVLGIWVPADGYELTVEEDGDGSGVVRYSRKVSSKRD